MPQKGSRGTALQKRVGINREPAAPRRREAVRASYLGIRQHAPDRRPSSKGCWDGFPSRAANASPQPFQNLIRKRHRRSVSKCAIHRSFKRTAATSHAQHRRFRHDYIGQDFDCPCGCRDSRSCGLRFCATCASASTPRSSPSSPQTLCVLRARSGSTLTRHPLTATGRASESGMAGAGTCVACASAFRITNKQQEENERPLRLLMQGPIFWGVRRRTLRCSNISPPSHRKHCQNLIRKTACWINSKWLIHRPFTRKTGTSHR